MGYLDDIIIYSRSEQEHLEHLEEIFIRLKAAGLKLKLEKCCFFKKHIQYLGHLISADGIQPLPEKLESIAKMPAPKNPKEVKQFRGLVGYYRKFVPRFADISRVLTHLTKKGRRIQMDTRVREMFPDTERILKTGTDTQIPRPPSKLHIVHRCIKVRLRQRTNTTQRRSRPPHHIRKWTISRITIKLGNTHRGGLCNLHVNQKTQLLYRYSQNNSQKRPPTIKEVSRKEHHEFQSKQLGSRTRITKHHLRVHPRNKKYSRRYPQ